ncbi:hypothetical protein QR680_007030 [Steinernema hermaphroditum]|uniref:PABS domain-containing protein n=1 Tax=Steinernema hermaphroditum TaxID=289476 RepID=A0AA39HXA8_9BILA|nr:hypothetical protein QR680_007030 [Steinernema hermaphroditum]
MSFGYGWSRESPEPEQPPENEKQFVGFVIYNNPNESEYVHLVYVDRENQRFKLPQTLFAPSDANMTKGQIMKKEERLTLGESIRFVATVSDAMITEFTRLEKKDSDFPDTKVVNNLVYKKVTCALMKVDGKVRCYCHLFGDIEISRDLSNRLMASVDFEAWVSISAAQGTGQKDQLKFEVAEVIGINIETDRVIIGAPWVQLGKKFGKRRNPIDPYDSEDEYEAQVERVVKKFYDGEEFDEKTEVRKNVSGVFLSRSKMFIRRRRILVDVGFRPVEDLSGYVVKCDTVFSRYLEKEIVSNYEVLVSEVDGDQVTAVEAVEVQNGKFYAELTSSKMYQGFALHRHLGWVYDRYQVLGLMDGSHNAKYKVALAPAYPLELGAKVESVGPAFIVDPDVELEESVQDAVCHLTEYFEASKTELPGLVFGRQVYCPRYANIRFDLKERDWGRFPTGTRVDFQTEAGDGIFFVVKSMRRGRPDEDVRSVDTKDGPVLMVSLSQTAEMPEICTCLTLATMVSDPNKKIVVKKEVPKNSGDKKKKDKKKDEKEKTIHAWVAEDTSDMSVTRFKVVAMYEDNHPPSVSGPARFNYKIRDSISIASPKEEDRESLVISRASLSRAATAMSMASTAPFQAAPVQPPPFPTPQPRVAPFKSAPYREPTPEFDFHPAPSHATHQSGPPLHFPMRPPSPAESMTIPSTSPAPSTIADLPLGDIPDERVGHILDERHIPTAQQRRVPSHHRGHMTEFQRSPHLQDVYDSSSEPEREESQGSEEECSEEDGYETPTAEQPDRAANAEEVQYVDDWQERQNGWNSHQHEQNHSTRSRRSQRSDSQTPQHEFVGAQMADDSNRGCQKCPATVILTKILANKKISKTIKEKNWALYLKVVQMSPYQDVLVFKSKTYGNVLVLDGVIQCTERDEFAYQEMLAHLAMCAHPNPRKVLIIGGGDGGIAREVLKHDTVEEVTMCEIDQMVVDVAKRFLPHMAKEFSNPKLNLFIGDGFEFLKSHKNEFDVVITDSSDPVGPAEKLFGKSYYQLLKEALRAGGVLSSQGECPWIDLSLIREMVGFSRELFSRVHYATATERDLSVPARILTDEQVRAMGLRFYNSEVHRAAFVLPQFLKEVRYDLCSEVTRKLVFRLCKRATDLLSLCVALSLPYTTLARFYSSSNPRHFKLQHPPPPQDQDPRI